MQTSHRQATRSAVLPMNAAPVLRPRAPWPFPAGGMRRKTDNMSATAKAVIATTAQAFFPRASGNATLAG